MTTKKSESLQRVLACFADAFANRGFEAVSLTEIAELARCSTTTIYEVYGSKENLFLAAITYNLEGISPPSIDLGEPRNDLEKLLEYAEARVRWLGNPQQRRVSSSLISPLSEIRRLVHEDIEAKYASISQIVSSAVASCIKTSLLLPFDLDVITHGILAGTIYEPFVLALYGKDVQADIRGVIRKVFTPFVTPAGSRVLQKYLRNMELREIPRASN